MPVAGPIKRNLTMNWPTFRGAESDTQNIRARLSEIGPRDIEGLSYEPHLVVVRDVDEIKILRHALVNPF